MSEFTVAELQAMLASAQQTTATEDRIVAKGSAYMLTNLLWEKDFAEGEIVISSDGSVVRFEDGEPITFGDLKNCREENGVRRDGSTGVNYPLVWSMTQTEASGAIDWLKARPAKPKENNFSGRGRKGSSPKAAPAKSPSPKVDNPVIDLQAMIAEGIAKAMAGIIPAKPEPVKVAPKVEGVMVTVVPGQIVNTPKGLRRVSADGERFNKTLDA